MTPDPQAVERFRRDLDRLLDPGARLGVAVSGGPDSLALLLLSSAARPRSVEAATVDHGLRPQSRAEAQDVAALCARIGVPHAILTAHWETAPTSQVQAQAREKRYRLLEEWAETRDLPAIATAHHLDDQAETLLMRLNRGAGAGGVSGIRASRALTPQLIAVRPLLQWRRTELGALCAGYGLDPVDDPSNDDTRFERSHARRLLAESDWLKPDRIAQAANNLGDADDALAWAAERLLEERVRRDGTDILVDGRDLPIELQRRLLAAAHEIAGNRALRGPDLRRAIKALYAGGTATLGSVKMVGEPVWRLQIAPPRRRTNPGKP